MPKNNWTACDQTGLTPPLKPKTLALGIEGDGCGARDGLFMCCRERDHPLPHVAALDPEFEAIVAVWQ